MIFINGLNNLAKASAPCVATIGNFDGVHLGHQQVIKTLTDKAQELSLPSTVITFEPLAKEFFQTDSVARLSSIEEKAELLFSLKVDQVLCIQFNSEFASYSPQGFVEDVLLDGLQVKYLSVGDDFRFGAKRVGDFQLLTEMAQMHDFEVESHSTFLNQGQRVSSGRVRAALLADDLKLAESLLGRPYSIAGVVAKGQQLGRTINYPTANIVLGKSKRAVHGVYAVLLKIDGEEGRLPGVANIGNRPTVDGQENRLEVHIFDFDRDIYDQKVTVRLVEKIRAEAKFDSFDALKKQIQLDADRAKQILAQKP